MGLSTPNNPVILQEGAAQPVSSGKVFGVDENQTKVNQIHGINSNNQSGAGIPKQVSNVQVSIANAQTGVTCTVSVLFKQDPTDRSFSGVNVWVKGYQGNAQLVQVASGTSSPCKFVLNNTGEIVSFTIQAFGNGGMAPLSAAPSCSGTLPKSTVGGYGSSTQTTITTQSNVTLPTQGCFWSFQGVVLAGGQATTSVSLTLGNSGATDAANRVICFTLFLASNVTISKISMAMSALGVGKCSCAIYSADGTQKLVDAGANAFDTNTSGVQVVTLGSPVTLTAGTYMFACSATTTGKSVAVGMQLSAGTVGYSAFYVKNFVRGGVAANAMSSGAMPSSLGVITAFPGTTGTDNCPGFFFEGSI